MERSLRLLRQAGEHDGCGGRGGAGEGQEQAREDPPWDGRVRLSKYRLAADGRTPIECSTYEWAQTYETRSDPHIENGETIHGDVRVSTVFLGLDHNWGEGPPVLWETMVFGGEHDQMQERYSSYEDAAAGHAAICALVFGQPSRRGM